MNAEDISFKKNVVVITLPENGHLLTAVGFLKRTAHGHSATLIVPTDTTKKVSMFLQQTFPDVSVNVQELSEAPYTSPPGIGSYTVLTHLQSTINYAHAIKKFLNQSARELPETTIILDCILEYLLDAKTIQKLPDIRILQSVVPTSLSMLWHYRIPLTHVIGKIHRWPKNAVKALLLTIKANKKSGYKIRPWAILKQRKLHRYIITNENVLKKIRQSSRPLKITNIWPIVEWQETVSPELAQFIKNYGKVVYISLGTIFNRDTDIYEKLLKNVPASDPLIIACPKEVLPEIQRITANRSGVFLSTYLPQLFVLKNTKLFITHAGFSGVNQAICFNVPMLMLPIIFEHEINAKIAGELGYGTILKEK